jgi:chromosome segregation ATPase
MTQPGNVGARLDALEAAVAQLRTGQETTRAQFAQAVVRLTSVEEQLTAGQPRLAALEAAAQGFDSRVAELERVAHEPSNADAARLEAVEAAVARLEEAVSRLGQVARPGRTVMRERLDQVQASVEEILKRLPEAPPPAGAR